MPQRKPITPFGNQPPHVALATELARLRSESGLSLRQLADKVGWDHSQLHTMERGKSLGGPEIIEALDTVYGTTPFLMRMWEAARNLSAFREKYKRYMQLEAEAVAVEHWAEGLVPGVLQTKAYARELLWSTPHKPGDVAELDKQLAARMSRKELLLRDPAPYLRTVFDEAVIMRGPRDPRKWYEQLAHLVEVASLPHVTLQVLPYSAGLHDLLGGAVTLLRRAEGRTAAWLENSKSGELIEDTGEVEQLRVSYDAVRDKALSPGDSVAFIKQVMEDRAPCDPSTST